MESTTIVIDLGKRAFQIHFVDTDGTIHSKANEFGVVFSQGRHPSIQAAQAAIATH
ncbi:hypothetical protein [Mycetohabitans rhizoxinica]|uniref:hypothetical protein n=1 Tax=Mycetohabitans rhizoxinica TaxID=412963 RepID=UPI0030D3624A